MKLHEIIHRTLQGCAVEQNIGLVGCSHLFLYMVIQYLGCGVCVSVCVCLSHQLLLPRVLWQIHLNHFQGQDQERVPNRSIRLKSHRTEYQARHHSHTQAEGNTILYVHDNTSNSLHLPCSQDLHTLHRDLTTGYLALAAFWNLDANLQDPTPSFLHA